MNFALVVPALNEEEAIGATLRRALAARARVEAETPVRHMAVVFVNDGSTDKTQEIVDRPEFSEVIKVRFTRNRGYGAAIKAGWKATGADLLGFIDADGTCDPEFCTPLINRLTETGADVVLASRLGPESQMPLVRKVGNFFFAKLLALFSNKHLTDCASGFRVVRRSSLRFLAPLPNGMHFTPAMSSICLLDDRLRIEEVPMPYRERVGRSKLSVVRDGFRFLHTILVNAFCYAPLRTAGVAAALAAAASGLLLGAAVAAGLPSTAAFTLGLTAVFGVLQLLWVGAVCRQLSLLVLCPKPTAGEPDEPRMPRYKPAIFGGLSLAALGLAGLLGGAWRSPNPHALVLIPTALGLTLGGSLVLGGVTLRVIWAMYEKQQVSLTDRPSPVDLSPEPQGPKAHPVVECYPPVPASV